MKNLTQNPVKWRLQTLLSLDPEEVHELACYAAAVDASYRLVMGRCLLALEENGGRKARGCSSSTHYGTSVLGVSVRMVRECKRVARALLQLPLLTLAAEGGNVTWSKLREIVRVATPATEEFWLELCKKHDCDTIAILVSATPFGRLPGDVEPEKACSTEFRCKASPELIQMFRRARRMFSLEQDQALTGAETLELLLASFFSTQPLDQKVLEKVRDEADKDLQAERAREIPLILEAREQAAEMGLMGEPQQTEHQPEQYEATEELLERAIGCQNATCCDPKRPGRVADEEAVLLQLARELENWQNRKVCFNPSQRNLSDAQRKEILRRDSWCCSTPGCPHQVWLHIHHITPYSEGGPTTKENLICLCAGCHRNLHNGYLKITPTASGKLIYTDAEGRRLDEQADLELAGWLDYWFGWRESEYNSHRLRAENGEWSVFV